MNRITGTEGNGGIRGMAVERHPPPLQIAHLLGLRSTPSARDTLLRYVQAGRNPARLNILFERICTGLGLEPGKFSAAIFIERFRKWHLTDLNQEPQPDSADYQVRFLLEKVFGCSLAYHKKAGLQIVSTLERSGLPDKLPDFQFEYPFPVSRPSPSPFSPAFPVKRKGELARCGALKEAGPLEKLRDGIRQLMGREKNQLEKLRERILFHLTEGHFRSAALLLFREPKARKVFGFVRKEGVDVKIAAKELAPLIELGLRPNASLTASEAAVAFLLAQIESQIAAYFIADLASADPQSAARVLGCVGQTTIEVEVIRVGDMRCYDKRSLAGFVLQAMLLRGETDLANRIILSGINDPAFGETFERVLNELHLNFSENVLTADAYRISDKSSLFLSGKADFRQPQDLSGTALIRAAGAAGGHEGLEGLSPREFYKHLAWQLYEGRDYAGAWETIACGRPEVEAFYDLTTGLWDYKNCAGLLRTRDRKEIAEFIIKVLKAGPQHLEGLAYVLRDLYEDVRDAAAFFEYLIEAELEIPGARDAAYAVLHFGALAIERPSLAPLMDRYQEILVQIEEDKKEAGWLDADSFIKESRFLSTDPPFKIREQRLKFYFEILAEETRSDQDRIYAVKMLTRMKAVEYLDDLRRVIARFLKTKNYTELSMSAVKAYFDISEELDLSRPEQQAPHKRAARFLKGTRDKLVDLFTADVKLGQGILAERDLAERDPAVRDRTLERARAGREQEIISQFNISLSSPPFTPRPPQYIDDSRDLADLATAMSQAGIPDQKITPIFQRATFSADSTAALIYLATAMAEAGMPAHKVDEVFNGAIHWAMTTKDKAPIADLHSAETAKARAPKQKVEKSFGQLAAIFRESLRQPNDFPDEIITDLLQGHFNGAQQRAKNNKIKKTIYCLIAAAISKRTNPFQDLPPASDPPILSERIIAWLHTRIYAVWGMGESQTELKALPEGWGNDNGGDGIMIP